MYRYVMFMAYGEVDCPLLTYAFSRYSSFNRTYFSIIAASWKEVTNSATFL
eukprot:gene10764-22488_t